jgi:DNA-binding XRE family transcriptional regulator
MRVAVDQNKRARLKKKGWKVGTTEEFLGLAPDEAAYIDLKLALSHQVRDYRLSKKLTQVELARLLNSSQSRVAKIETGDASVSLDLLVRSLLALGAGRKELARMIAAR